MSEINELKVKKLIDELNLAEHVEGGYFSETYRSTNEYITELGSRSVMTSIYYMLTTGSSVGHFHMNRSAIMHYFHSGDPIDYYVITQEGKLTHHVMGPDASAGQVFQLLVEGDCWKASRLSQNGLQGYGLIGEAVAPGFDFADMKLGDRKTMLAEFPEHNQIINQLTRTE